MKNYDELVKLNHSLYWSYIPDYPYRILIIRGLGSGKTNMLLNAIKNQRPDIGKIYLYIKDPFESVVSESSINYLFTEKKLIKPKSLIIYN